MKWSLKLLLELELKMENVRHRTSQELLPNKHLSFKFTFETFKTNRGEKENFKSRSCNSNKAETMAAKTNLVAH